MDSSLKSNGGVGGGVSVRKYSSTFLWYFFQTLTVSSMLLMVLSIYWTFSSGNIRVVCVISVAFAIFSPSFIIPNLPQISAVAIPILALNKTFCIRMLNISGWMFCGYVYPFPVHLSCYSLMVGVGLLKLYGGGGPGSLKFIGLIGGDAAGPCLSMFNHEIQYGSGRWVDSGAGWALLGLVVVTLLAYYLPPLVEPEKMMNEIAAISIEVASDEKKKVNVAEEAPTPGSGTNTSLLETVEWD